MTGLFAWPSVLLLVGNLAFAVFLLPTLRGDNKPALSTAWMTAGMLWVFVVANFGLGAILGAVGAALDAAAWTWLTGQCVARDRHG